VSGQVERSHTTHLAGIPGLRTFGTAEIDIIPIVKTITKYAVMVDDPKTIRYHLEKAAYLAMSGRPGPVWLDIPMDVQFAIVDEDELEGYTPPQEQSYGSDSDLKINEVLKLLERAKRPLIVAGHGIRQGQAIEQLRELVERAEIPVIFSRFGQDYMPFSHPLNFGQAGLKGSRYCGLLMRSADVVLSLGCRLAAQLVGHKFDAFDADATVVMVDVDEAELQKPGVPIDLPIHADVKAFIGGIIEQMDKEKLPDWQPWISECQKLKHEHPMVRPDHLGTPIDLYNFMSKLDAVSGERHIFTTDAGSNYYVGGQVYRFEHGQREITSGTFASMGLSIPLAIGAAISDADAQVLAVTGDGSLELNIQELKTMSHYGLNIKLFVINNGGYVSMRNWQDNFFEGRRIESEESTGAGTLQMQNIAKAFDLPYSLIDNPDKINEQLKDIIGENGPMFIEVICNQNQKIIEPIKDLSYAVTD
jgi:acetolactate synthase-1/2/3 large subunit